MKKINVVAINASPYKKGTVVNLLKRFLDSSKKHNATTKMIHLVDYTISPCRGCYSRGAKYCKYPCVVKDDMQKIYPILEKADVIAFGSPVYWFNMSGMMKNFIDRLTCTYNGYILKNKIGVFVAASKENEGGRATASIAMASAMNHLGLLIPPFSIMFYPGEEDITKKGKTVHDKWIFKDLSETGEDVIKLAKFLRNSKLDW